VPLLMINKKRKRKKHFGGHEDIISKHKLSSNALLQVQNELAFGTFRCKD